jgi:polysaccharide deacetylase 2 family uncharacterized protein YibQ
MGGVPLDEEGSMRKRKLKKRTRDLLIAAAAGALIVAIIVLAGVWMRGQKTPSVREETPSEVSRSAPPGTAGAPEKIILGEQLLIKGCLFDLGVSRENVRIKGRTVEVTLNKDIRESQIKYAFAPLAEMEGVELKIEEPSKVAIIINSHEWEIVFRVRAPEKKLERVAIIIDDMGLDMEIARQLCAIDADLTFSVMPHQLHTEGVANLLHEKGREVLLHIPMEGASGKNPGPGSIYRNMDPAQAVTLMKEAFKAVPHIDGVNNHMGSEVTQDEAIMRALLSLIKEKGLFFIDSVTTGKSVCGEVASELRLPFEARDVFLDNEQTYAYVAGQLEELVTVAKRHGKAIAICHPHPVTAQVLAQEVPKLKSRGIAVVRVSALVRNRM